MVYTRSFGLAVAATALVAGVQAQGTSNLKACVPEGQFTAGANVDYFPEKSNLATREYLRMFTLCMRQIASKPIFIF